jgi:hypothetical protein
MDRVVGLHTFRGGPIQRGEQSQRQHFILFIWVIADKDGGRDDVEGIDTLFVLR